MQVRRAAVPGLLLSALSLATVTLSGQATFSEAAVRDARRASNAAIAQRDTAALVAMVSANYHSTSSRNVHSSGPDGVRAQWAQQFSSHPDVAYVRTSTRIRLFEPWQMAEETGTWTGRWKEPDGRVDIGGSYVAKWRRTGGRWILETEVFSPLHCRGSTYCTNPPE